MDALLLGVLLIAWGTAWIAAIRVWIRIGSRYEEDVDWIAHTGGDIGRKGLQGRLMNAAGRSSRIPLRHEDRPPTSPGS